MRLRAGDWVQVRSKEEILRSLDRKGQFEGLPFMPQMFQFCGQRFRVYKRAHKTCDTVTRTGGRRLANAVHLELRCDGEAYGGCQAGCLIFWKDAWLEPLGRQPRSAESSVGPEPQRSRRREDAAGCTEEDVRAGTHSQEQPVPGETSYVCQATELPKFTMPLPWWNIRQYVEDYTSGNVALGRMCRGFAWACFNGLTRVLGRASRLGRLYDRFQALWGGLPYPKWSGLIQAGHQTPACSSDLKPGELVRVKLYKEILATLDVNGKNRGLRFDPELVPYCGGLYRVRTRLNTFLDERTGKLVTTKHPAIILENVWCQARYSECRLFCPRSIYSWWREAWLERLPPSGEVDGRA